MKNHWILISWWITSRLWLIEKVRAIVSKHQKYQKLFQIGGHEALRFGLTKQFGTFLCSLHTDSQFKLNIKWHWHFWIGGSVYVTYFTFCRYIQKWLHKSVVNVYNVWPFSSKAQYQVWIKRKTLLASRLINKLQQNFPITYFLVWQFLIKCFLYCPPKLQRRGACI